MAYLAPPGPVYVVGVVGHCVMAATTCDRDQIAAATLTIVREAMVF